MRYVIVVLIAVFILSGCVNNRATVPDGDNVDIQNQESSGAQADGQMSETNYIISYCAKENSDENLIYFNYPQFQETIVNAIELNEVIVGFVGSALQEICEGGFKGTLRDSPENLEWDNSNYTLQAMDIDYEIVRSDSDYFSVKFEGLYNNKTSAHPVNYFNSLTIDLGKCERATLSDLYSIDGDFVKLIRNKFQEQIREGLAERVGVSFDEIPESTEELLSLQDDEMLLESLRQADKNNDGGFYSFLKETALGISVPVEHAVGDHFEIIIPYDDLKSFTN